MTTIVNDNNPLTVVVVVVVIVIHNYINIDLPLSSSSSSASSSSSSSLSSSSSQFRCVRRSSLPTSWTPFAATTKRWWTPRRGLSRNWRHAMLGSLRDPRQCLSVLMRISLSLKRNVYIYLDPPLFSSHVFSPLLPSSSPSPRYVVELEAKNEDLAAKLQAERRSRHEEASAAASEHAKDQEQVN